MSTGPCLRQFGAVSRCLPRASSNLRPATPAFLQTSVRCPARQSANAPYRAFKTEAFHKLNIANEGEGFAPALLRDLCQCPQCVDASTKQKLFSTADIPSNISVADVQNTESHVQLKWTNDVPHTGPDHVTKIPHSQLQNLLKFGNVKAPVNPPRRVLWEADRFTRDVDDLDYDAYMQDDQSLHKALQTLHTHGLLFLTKVPEDERSVSNIAERIGPIKNTFYGYTWDVRSVPQAKNVAYTSQDLGFHMDLLYMHQPPHLQFLHCIRSSSAGGASLFTDSFRAVQDVHKKDPGRVANLISNPVHFHYDHPDSQYYRQARRTVEIKKARSNPRNGDILSRSDWDIAEIIEAVAWSPPFQAPFSAAPVETGRVKIRDGPNVPTQGEYVSAQTESWLYGARTFNRAIHREEGIYERMMKPGECVLFDNRRVLHARRKFEVGDAGKERWLRGAYLDKDPYESRMQLLQARYGPLNVGSTAHEANGEA